MTNVSHKRPPVRGLLTFDPWGLMLAGSPSRQIFSPDKRGSCQGKPPCRYHHRPNPHQRPSLSRREQWDGYRGLTAIQEMRASSYFVVCCVLLNPGALGFAILPGNSLNHQEITEEAILSATLLACRDIAQSVGTVFTFPVSMRRLRIDHFKMLCSLPSDMYVLT
jgi:hypothetical protein